MPMPFIDQEFTLTQPDGALLRVLGSGNAFHATFRTPDGKEVVKDPATGFFRPGTDADIAAKAALAEEEPPRRLSRWEVRRLEQEREDLLSVSAKIAAAPGAPVRRLVAGNYIGLCLPVAFPDRPASMTPQQIGEFCNTQGYRDFGNNGSVRDYFFDVSGGKLVYTNLVAPYYTARNKSDYYNDKSVKYGIRAQELVTEALDYHLHNGFDFSQLSTDSGGHVYAVNLFYAGDRPPDADWGTGLWPHQGTLARNVRLRPGMEAADYQVCNIGTDLSLGTFCHENGHMICDFPDLYSYDKDSGGVGTYCLMCYGGNADPKNPVQVGAYLKSTVGWTASSTTLAAGSGTVTLHAGRNEFAVLLRGPKEYFIFENRERNGRDAALASVGLAVWHVDERGDNTHPSQGVKHNKCSLLQADGRDDLARYNAASDSTDLFRAGLNDAISGNTHPPLRWWDNTAPALAIDQIGPPGAAVSFRVVP